jgi:hypothetical protein
MKHPKIFNVQQPSQYGTVSGKIIEKRWSSA